MIFIEKLLIVGAGGHGRSCLDIARKQDCYHEICFLDDKLDGRTINDCKVIGSFLDMDKYCNEFRNIFIAVGNNVFRKQLFNIARACGYNIITLISPDAKVSAYAKIEEGTVVFDNVVIETNATLGKGCVVTSNATINHDAVIENYCLVYSNSVIRPNTLIGSLSRIGSNCTVTFDTKIKAGSDIKDGLVVKPFSEYSFEVDV